MFSRPSVAFRPRGHHPPQGSPNSIATASAARSTPVCPPLTIRSLRFALIAAAAGLVASASAGELIVRTVAGTGEKGHGREVGPALTTPCTDPMSVTGLSFSMLTIDVEGPSYLVVSQAKPRSLRLIRYSRERGTSLSSVLPDEFKGEPYDTAYVNEACHPLNELYSIYVVERLTGLIKVVTWRRFKPSAPQVIAGGGEAESATETDVAKDAKFNEPHDLCYDGDEIILVADTKNDVIRRIVINGSCRSRHAEPYGRMTVFGTQTWNGKKLRGPRVIEVDVAKENQDGFIVAYREDNRIFAIDNEGSVVAHLAGTGAKGYSGDGKDAKQAKLGGPKGMVIGSGGDVYFADTENHVIRKIDRRTGTISTVVGDGNRGDGPDGPARKCRLNRPHGLYLDRNTLFIADTGNHRIRAVEVFPGEDDQ